MTRDLIPLEKIEAIEKESRAFICPCCKAHLQFLVRVSVVGVRESSEREAGLTMPDMPPRSSLKSRFTPDEQAVLDEAKDLLPAFTAALKVSTTNLPADTEHYFLTWLARAVRKAAPQFGIRLCLPENEREGNLEMWTFCDVAAILADGSFRAFVPTPLTKGETVRSLEVTNGDLRKSEPVTLERWIRTRYGYVTHRGLMFQELRQRCIGDFDSANKR